jgi:hypothetical protein
VDAVNVTLKAKWPPVPHASAGTALSIYAPCTEAHSRAWLREALGRLAAAVEERSGAPTELQCLS